MRGLPPEALRTKLVSAVREAISEEGTQGRSDSLITVCAGWLAARRYLGREYFLVSGQAVRPDGVCLGSASWFFARAPEGRCEIVDLCAPWAYDAGLLERPEPLAYFWGWEDELPGARLLASERATAEARLFARGAGYEQLSRLARRVLARLGGAPRGAPQYVPERPPLLLRPALSEDPESTPNP